MADIDYSIKDIENFIDVNGTVKKVEVSRLTAPGENFLSLVLRVDFEVEKDGVSKTYNTVTKRLPLGERKSIEFNCTAMRNEIKWYTEIVKLITDFAEEEEIEGTDFIPTYCGSRYSLDPQKKEADNDSFLILENLIEQGFKNIDRFEGFNLSETRAILKKMALFHSIPLVMKFKKPELFKVLKDFMNLCQPKSGIPELVTGKDRTNLQPEVKDPRTLLLEAAIKMPECSPFVDKLKLQLNKPPHGPFSWDKIGPEPWSTMLHNDFWVNNIMINRQNGKKPLVKIVDYQMCTYGSFAKDLIFFILTSVNNGVTQTYLDDLLKFYYEEFTSVLRKTKVDLELTFTAFLKEIQRVVHESEFTHALYYIPGIFAPKGTVEDVALKEVDVMELIIQFIQDMNQHHKNKLAILTTESAHRNWI